METGEVVKGISEKASKEEVDHEALTRKKEELKKKFDAEYDDKGEETPAASYYDEIKEGMAKQLELNRAEFEDDDPSTRAMVEGYRPGTYVRILLKNMPCEFVKYFDPAYPVIIGGLLANEENLGFIRVSILSKSIY
jgi:ribosome biogenesis protein BMS1